ncbi:MAG TPA: hypothetical protein VGD01_06900 [Candidatus Elarobacter sp.]|jgi:hypothetical protein
MRGSISAHSAPLSTQAMIAPPGALPPGANATLRLAKGDPRNVAAALLFREILKPLANGLGPVGEIALGAVADNLFVRRAR